MTEAEILRAVRLAVGGLPDVCLWRNSVGVATHRDGRTVPYGICRGAADLLGVLAPSGRFVALEVKSARGRLTREQDLFLALVRHYGGFACVVRSVNDALEAIVRARTGELNA